MSLWTDRSGEADHTASTSINVWNLSAGLQATRSPAGKIVQVEIQQTNGVPTADIFSSPSLHHLSSSLGFLVVLDALSRRRGSFQTNE